MKTLLLGLCIFLFSVTSGFAFQLNSPEGFSSRLTGMITNELASSINDMYEDEKIDELAKYTMLEKLFSDKFQSLTYLRIKNLIKTEEIYSYEESDFIFSAKYDILCDSIVSDFMVNYRQY